MTGPYEFFLPCTIPSKKNRNAPRKGGFYVPRELRQELDSIELMIRSRWKDRDALTGANVSMHFQVSSFAGDMDNKATTLLDCLVKAGVLVDDNMSHLAALEVKRTKVPKSQEGVRVSLQGTTCGS
jgi:Holliday junction resolvase RusA-like endonuclease